jgi:hypothetical protein
MYSQYSLGIDSLKENVSRNALQVRRRKKGIGTGLYKSL